MFRESEFEFAARQLEYELETFDPKPTAAGTIIISGFAPGSARLGPTQKAAVERFTRRLLAEMRTKPITAVAVVRFEGHEDETGDPANFQKLSEPRASAVFNHFLQRLEIHLKRLTGADVRKIEPVIAMAGPNRPIRSNVTAAGRALNRRVEIRVKWRT